jgi:site-specific DNA recombinase
MKAALYARVSTNEQRKESIDDQLRECRELCRRHDFDVIEEYSDRGQSGNEVNRPGYQRLLRAARHRDYDVIVAHELSRLWRSESEMHAIKEELEYLNVHVVTDDGVDTRIVGMDILIAVKGAMAKQELRQIAHRTHRALKGLALDGRSAGGKCYGYLAATKSGTGKREINEAQAREVRRIFVWYAAGRSPRWIAERLNEESVSSPGSDWARTKRRRDGKWLASAIHGDPKRGSGILNNELYIGRYIWNRRQSRKKLRSGDREFLQRPPEEWVTTSHPELRIVSDDVWQKVKARQRERADQIGARVRLGLSKYQAYAIGAYPKYLLSGLLRCGLCGSNLIVSGPAQGYVCATRVNGGLRACSNRLRLPRVRLERLLLSWIHSVLIGAESEQCLLRAWRARNRENSPGAEYAAPGREAELKLAAEVGSAIARGIGTLRSSEYYEQFVTTIAARFHENPRETRATLSDLLGGAIRLIPKGSTQELALHCELSNATFGLAQLLSSFSTTRHAENLGGTGC